jgi:methionyl aminopeptidase
MIVKRQKDEDTIREACDISMKILYELGQNVRKGKFTNEIDSLAGKLCGEYGVKPSFKSVDNYQYNICISINNEVLHGLPVHKEPLKIGDIVKLDFGIIYKGFCTDHCWTFGVEKLSKEDMRLLTASKEATENALIKTITGNRTGDLGYEMEHTAEKYGFNTVWEYAGHGIGRRVHEDSPSILSYGSKHTGEVLRDGMLVCVECQVVDGSGDVYVDSDGWTIKSAEGGKAGHYEYMAIVRDYEPDILTPMFDWPVIIK